MQTLNISSFTANWCWPVANWQEHKLAPVGIMAHQLWLTSVRNQRLLIHCPHCKLHLCRMRTESLSGAAEITAGPGGKESISKNAFFFFSFFLFFLHLSTESIATRVLVCAIVIRWRLFQTDKPHHFKSIQGTSLPFECRSFKERKELPHL